MADILTKEQRHKCMSNIKGKDTKPELIVRKFLFSKGLRFRLHRKDLVGNPDIVLPRYKTVIFVNGCFWHGHDNCRYFRLPKSNVEFWKNKIERNMERDYRNEVKLKELGWKVIRIWECEIRNMSLRTQKLEELYGTITGSFTIPPIYECSNRDTLMVAESETSYINKKSESR